MENTDMKKCPDCAELIKAEAIKCRYCGSDLNRKTINFDFFSTPGYWHRVDEGKKVAGVCTGIAQQLDSPMLILPLRLFFVITTIFYGFGIILYVILWILMPPPQAGQATGKTTPSGGPKPYGAPGGGYSAPVSSPVQPAGGGTAETPTDGATTAESSGPASDTEQPVATSRPAEQPSAGEPQAPAPTEEPRQQESARKDRFDDFHGGSSGVSEAEFIEIRNEDDAAPETGKPQSGQNDMKRISSRMQAGIVAVVMIVITFMLLLLKMDAFAIPAGRLLVYAAAGVIVAGVLYHHQSHRVCNSSAGILE